MHYRFDEILEIHLHLSISTYGKSLTMSPYLHQIHKMQEVYKLKILEWIFCCVYSSDGLRIFHDMLFKVAKLCRIAWGIRSRLHAGAAIAPLLFRPQVDL